MNFIPYTYCIIRYVHDPVASEMLNIGVVMWAPTQPFLGIRMEHRFERLSQTFAGFDGEHYKRTLRQLESSFERLREEFTDSLFPVDNMTNSIAGMMNTVWPDEELSFRAGPVMAGVAHIPELELEEIFKRFVDKQYSRQKTEKRTDEEVWSIYSKPLFRAQITRKLVPKTIETDEFSIKFDHSFKNERWHVLEPLSMDYKKVESIQNRATTWLGNATALKESPEMGTLYLLLGRPRESGHEKAYIKAKNLLHKMPIKHELIEESDAEDFAEDLYSYMKEHGIITPADE
jgi:hypothetical protein